MRFSGKNSRGFAGFADPARTRGHCLRLSSKNNRGFGLGRRDGVAGPGGPPRTVAPGQRADLLLLAVPMAVALERLQAEDVVWSCVSGVART